MLVEFNDRARDCALAKSLGDTTKLSASLFAHVAAASPRLLTLKAIGKTDRLDRLTSCEAWTGAALELIALEVPGWRVKRLVSMTQSGSAR